MFSTKLTFFAILAIVAVTTEGGVVGPAVAPVAPLAYTNAVPYNIPPYADSVNIVNRGLRVPLAAAYAAAPYLHATPLAAGVVPAPAIAPAFARLSYPAPALAAPVAPALAAPVVPGYPAPLAIGNTLPAPFYK